MTRRGWEDELPLDQLRPGVEPRCWWLCVERPAPDLSDVVAARLPGPGHMLQLWEPLRTKAPRPSRCQPYCCYARTVIFYHRPYISVPARPSRWRDGALHAGGKVFAQFDQIETRLGSDDVVEFDGDLFVIGGGTVRWHHRRWWMHRWARRRPRIHKHPGSRMCSLHGRILERDDSMPAGVYRCPHPAHGAAA